MPDVDASTVFALLRATLNADQAGVDAIMSTTDPQALVMALAAWANEVGIGQYGGEANWDRQLEVFLTRGPVDSAG
jgi:hypothetical protein